MNASGGDVEFVVSSSVRSDVLEAVGDGATTTAALLDGIDASTSAIYGAVGDLQDRGLLTETDEGLVATGSGQVLADVVEHRRQCGSVLDSLGDYFETHDASPLPSRFRLRIGALAGGTVVRATETEPQRAVDEVSERIAAAGTARVVSPIYVESYEEAMPDSPGSKLLLDGEVVRAFVESGRAQPDEEPYDDSEVRIGSVDVALGVTDDALLLSLPRLDGGYDARSEVVVESDRARRWGNRLFEHYWEESLPVPEFLSRLDA